MTKKIVIGIGNPLRGDDALGYVVVNAFNEKYGEGELADVDCFHMQQLGLELLPYFEDCEVLIFVDASVKVDEGVLQMELIEPGSMVDNPVSHFFDPETLLSSTYALYQAHPKTYLLSVGASDFEIREGLSEKIEASVPKVLEKIESILFE